MPIRLHLRNLLFSAFLALAFAFPVRAETRPVSDAHLSRCYDLFCIDQIITVIYESVGNFVAQQIFVPFPLTIDTGAVAWNLDEAQVATLDLSTNATLSAPTNIEHGGFYTLLVTQTSGGSHTLSYNAVFNLGDAGAPTLSTAAGDTDVITFIGFSGEMLLVGFASGY